MNATRPETFILVHGAWIGDWAWAQVSTLLREQGYRVYIPCLPGHGREKKEPGTITLQDYVDEVIRVMETAGGATILVGHSFAGVLISQIAELRTENVSGLVYLCACLLPNGVSFLEAANGIQGSSVLDNLEPSPDGTTVTIKDDCLHGGVAHDVPSATFEAAKPHLVPEPILPLATPLSITYERWGVVPRFYIECTKDRAIPLGAQQAMHQLLGVQQVFSLESSHSPMFSCPLELAEHLTTIAEAIQREQER